MQVNAVVWDDANERDILSLGFAVEEIEDVLYDDRNDTVILDETDGSLGLFLTTGTARTGRAISVKSRVECGNPLHIYPISAVLNRS
jgi:hypothetical protein